MHVQSSFWDLNSFFSETTEATSYSLCNQIVCPCLPSLSLPCLESSLCLCGHYVFSNLWPSQTVFFWSLSNGFHPAFLSHLLCVFPLFQCRQFLILKNSTLMHLASILNLWVTVSLLPFSAAATAWRPHCNFCMPLRTHVVLGVPQSHTCVNHTQASI